MRLQRVFQWLGISWFLFQSTLAFSAVQEETWLNPPQRRALQVLEKPASVVPEAFPERFSALTQDTFSAEALRFFESRSLFKATDLPLSGLITQAEWVTLLYEAIGEKPWFVNDEPYYPDVPVSHWAFTAFEAFRLKQWIPLEGLNAQGQMSPDSFLNAQQALLTLGRTLRDEPYSWANAEQLLQEYKIDVSKMKLEDMEALSHVLAAGFWPVLEPDSAKQKNVDLKQPMTRLSALRLAYQRYLLTQQQLAVLDDTDKRLPEGLILTISPTTVIFLNRLEVGGPSYFFLKEALDVPSLGVSIPVGARVFARVRGVAIEENKPPIVTMLLEQVVLPSGEKYTVNAKLVLVFPQKEPRWFLPSARFETVTKQVERLIVK